MADSDDEYDRRRGRDKFRRERSDYQDRRDDRNRRDDWNDRESWSSNRDNRNGSNRRGDYRDYSGSRRDRYSPSRHDLSPPLKRVRRDWEDRGSNYVGSYDSNFNAGGQGHPHTWGHDNSHYRDDQGPTQPPMMTFKQFLSSQDDSIDDQEAVKKYGEYKLEFSRQQINDFFLNHKEEEWFKLKYHPEDSTRKQAEHQGGLKKRLEVYQEFLTPDIMEKVTLDVDQTENIIKLLDSVVIKLEGGTDFDLKSLDISLEETKPESTLPKRETKEDDTSSAKKQPESPKEQPEEPVSKKRKRGRGYDSDYSRSDSDSGEESDREQIKTAEEKISDEEKVSDDEKLNDDEKINDTEKVSDDEKMDDDDDGEINQAEKATDEEKLNEEEKSLEPEDAKKEIDEEKATSEPIDPSEKDSAKEEEKLVEEEAEEANHKDEKEAPSAEQPPKADEPKSEKTEPEVPKPRPLHKTCSIFLRNLAPTITKQEVEAMCKRYPGFLRAAISDPTVERRFFRRGWVTFERTVNIKEICWNFNNVRLRDCELGAIVNRDLSRRVRSVSGITSHRHIVRSDIKSVAKIIQNLDDKQNLWVNNTENSVTPDASSQPFGLVSSNPLLKNITDYLIEEASAEEEELLGTAEREDKDKENGSGMERDETLTKVLDRLILYLRIVHSVDFYNCSEYSAEDEMPNRCGIIHARGGLPSSKITMQEVNDYINHFETKISPFLVPFSKLSEEESVKLGKKNSEVEVENFIKANTQELAKDKWLCPLSGKKFKGPDFVRKHIFNKHSEKVEEVKKEVEYFNNYLLDPKRPQLPEHPGNPRAHGSHGDMHGNHAQGMNQQGYNRSNYQGRQGYQSRNSYNDPYRTGGYNQRRGFSNPRDGRRGAGSRSQTDISRRASDGRSNTFRNDPREIIGYHDLDAPQDVDIL